MIDTARRRFLASGAVIGAAALTAAKAMAFSLDTDNAEAEKLYLSACTAQNSYHQQLLAEVTAKLSGRPQQEIDATVAALKCPSAAARSRRPPDCRAGVRIGDAGDPVALGERIVL